MSTMGKQRRRIVLVNSLGKDAYYAAREEQVVAGQALNQAMSEEGVMNVTFDNCKIGRLEMKSKTMSPCPLLS